MTHASPSHALCRGSLVRRPAHHVSPDPPFLFPSEFSSLFSSLSLYLSIFISPYSLFLSPPPVISLDPASPPVLLFLTSD